MPDVTVSPVVEALVGALETTAFISPLPWEGSPPDYPAPPEAPMLLVSIVFHARTSGVLELVAPLALGRCMVANVLGPDTPPDQIAARAGDALKEIMNVTCGSFLRPSISAPGPRPTMEIPRAGDFDAANWGAFVSAPGTSILDADGHLVAIRVRDEG